MQLLYDSNRLKQELQLRVTKQSFVTRFESPFDGGWEMTQAFHRESACCTSNRPGDTHLSPPSSEEILHVPLRGLIGGVHLAFDHGTTCGRRNRGGNTHLNPPSREEIQPLCGNSHTERHMLKKTVWILLCMLFLVQTQCFAGSKNTKTNESSPRYKTHYTVAKDSTGDFTKIQDAIDACKSFPYKRITVYIKNGVYHEKVRVPSWNTKITMIGESKNKTIITYGDYFDKIKRGRNSTFFTYSLRVDGNDFRAENLTIENSAGPVGQAVALHVEADRCMFVNCRMLGNQDTVYLAGENSRDYFKDCYITGTTDFIFGQATALFEDCTIEIKANSYVTAASTPKGVPFGFVFKNCKLTAANGVNQVFLGRPWRDYAKTVFIHCWMGKQIRPKGWYNWNSKRAEQESLYGEYKSEGPGADPSDRVSWSHQLTEEQATKYTLDNIFDGWKPEIEEGGKIGG